MINIKLNTQIVEYYYKRLNKLYFRTLDKTDKVVVAYNFEEPSDVTNFNEVYDGGRGVLFNLNVTLTKYKND